MKSTPFETRAFYVLGHPNHPKSLGKPLPSQWAGKVMFGGFQFTDGAMSLRLPAQKAERNAKYLRAYFGVHDEVIQRVDVPARARTYSPKSEAEGVLGLVDESAPAAEGTSEQANGGDGKPANTPNAASLETIRRDNRGRGSSRGSSAATPTKVDPAKREELLKDDDGDLT